MKSLSDKQSPFVFTTETLDDLTQIAANDPAVLDLVGGYVAARENFAFFAEQVVAELDHYGVPL